MSRGSSTFGHYGGVDQVPRQWVTAFFTSSVLYAGLAVLAMVIGVSSKQVSTERPVDVTFVEKVVKEEPPPPPPSPVEIKPEPAPPPAPVVPKDMKVRKLEKPPPPKELVAPKEMPREAPKEVDPSLDKGIAVFGEPGEGDPAGLEGGMVSGRAGGKVGAPIALPDGAVPPKPLATNAPPAYPKTARKAGKEGMVTLKIVILADGRVTDVQVVEGEEPFVSAAVDAVKNWEYQPARYKGQPISIYRTIQVGFKLT
jgi:protein TonB